MWVISHSHLMNSFILSLILHLVQLSGSLNNGPIGNWHALCEHRNLKKKIITIIPSLEMTFFRDHFGHIEISRLKCE